MDRVDFDYDNGVGSRVIVERLEGNVPALWLTVNGHTVELAPAEARRLGTAIVDASDRVQRDGRRPERRS